jgi:DNA topoisomerase I
VQVVSHAPPRPPGLTRVAGRWYDQRGEPVAGGDLVRLRRLAIPPAWTHVWADPDPAAALQAVGEDARGRTQYRYHPDAVAARARDKFEHVARFADALPLLRAAAADGLAGSGLGRERVLAASVRLLERGFFRVGNEQYARDNHTYGLTTLQRCHVQVRGAALGFDYVAKEHLHRVVEVRDEQAAAVVRALLRRTEDSPALLAWNAGRGHWVHVTSAHVNAYVHALAGLDASAKSFRTWTGTVLAAAALAGADLTGLAGPNARAPETAAVQATSRLLGNTPSVARASYIHPAVLAAAKEGLTVRADLAEAAERSGTDRLAQVWTDAGLQAAVRRLLGWDVGLPALLPDSYDVAT